MYMICFHPAKMPKEHTSTFFSCLCALKRGYARGRYVSLVPPKHRVVSPHGMQLIVPWKTGRKFSERSIKHQMLSAMIVYCHVI